VNAPSSRFSSADRSSEVEHARRIEREAEFLDVTGVYRGSREVYSLRLVMLHVIQQYDRRNGHADLLHEGIDGAVGV
jgi:hypothetical protein